MHPPFRSQKANVKCANMYENVFMKNVVLVNIRFALQSKPAKTWWQTRLFHVSNCNPCKKVIKLSAHSSLKIKTSPQPGSRKNRERDGILVRDGIGKGTGSHSKIPQSRYLNEMNDIPQWKLHSLSNLQFPTTAIFAFMLITLIVIINKEKLPECPSDSQCHPDFFLNGKSSVWI